jgi:hypothetical protein
VGIAVLTYAGYRLIGVFAAQPGLADQLDQLVRQWWPIAIVVLGLVGFLRLADTRQAIRGPILLVFVGAGLLLITARPFDGTQWESATLPIMLLPIGWWLTASGSLKGWRHDDENTPQWTVVGDTRQVRSSASALTDASAYVVAGGLVIDLTQANTLRSAKLAWNVKQDGHGALLALTAIAGGIDVLVPPTWHVTVDKRKRLLGHCRGPREVTGDELTGQLTIHAIAVFGGIDVRRAR